MIKELDLPQGWKVTALLEEFKLYKYWEVEKWVNDDKLVVKAILMTLDYSAIEDDKWNKNFLENSFEDLVSVFAKNLNFLPDPLYFDFVEGGFEKEPILIFRPIEGEKIEIDWSYDNDLVYEYVLYVIEKVAHLLRRLHEKDIIARSLNKDSIIIGQSGNYYFYKFASLIYKDNYVGYNPAKQALEPKKIYSAPECFNPQKSLTTETDVYVLGKFILQLLMKEEEYNKYFEANPFPIKQEYETLIKDLNVSDGIKSLLVGTLARDRDYRFYDMYEVINKLKGIKQTGRSGLKAYYSKIRVN